MRRTEALQGVRMIKFLSILSRYEAAEFSQVEAAELVGEGEGQADVPARAPASRGRWRCRASRPAAGQGLRQAGSSRPGGGDGSALADVLYQRH